MLFKALFSAWGFQLYHFTQLRACFNRKKRERLKTFRLQIVMVKATIPQEFLEKTKPEYALNISFKSSYLFWLN